MRRHRIDTIWRVVIAVLLTGWFVTNAGASPASADDWQAGLAKTVITPDEPMWLTGYGGRAKPSEGKIHDLYARAAAIRDPAGKTIVVVSCDLIGIPAEMARIVSEAVEQRHGIPRRNLMLASSHTHCGPALDQPLSHMLMMNADDWKQVKAYQQQLNQKVIAVIDRAIEDLQPARLATGIGEAGFATNRRPPIGQGPYDHDVPVLRITSPDGSALRGVLFGYACHNTTLSFYQWCGDYAGFAALYLESRHPEATALFFEGCGGDQNPLPRRKVELAEKYGRMLGRAVETVLDQPMTPVTGPLRTDFRTVDVAFESVPTREELEADRHNENRYRRQRAEYLLGKLDAHGSLSKTYPYPIQVWQLGDHVTWVALGGEVVVDYSLRLKKELGPRRTWVAAYANDVMAYIPSERVLSEGGYEGETSMVVYQQPSKWQSGLEETIVRTVEDMAAKLRDVKPSAR